MTSEPSRTTRESREIHAEFAHGSVTLHYDVKWNYLDEETRANLNVLIDKACRLGGTQMRRTS